MGKYLQGYFKPKHPEKYKGDASRIIYRSSWELKLMMWLDKNDDVISYSSEEHVVPYRSPIDGKMHRYFPDFLVKVKTRDKKTKVLMIEVKPDRETREPVKKTKLTKQYINEVQTWGVNSAKWDAAEEYCKDRGWEFVVMTEKHLGITR